MYPHQLERLTAAMESGKLAALVATTPSNLFYVSGFRRPGPASGRGAEMYGVFTRGGVALVAPAADAATVAVEGAAVDHVRCYGRLGAAEPTRSDDVSRRVSEWTRDASPSPDDALVQALGALGVSGGHIGLDEGGLGAATWRGVAERLPGFTVVEGSAAFAEARSVKGPWEIECLQRALHVAEEAANEVIQALAPAMTERDAVARFGDAVRARGGEAQGVVILFGARSAYPAAGPTDSTLRAGDLVKLDVGCVVKGFHGRLARTAVTERPSDEQQRAHDAIQAGLEAALAAVRPGAIVGTVVDRALSVARDAGLPAYDRGQIGHGIGLEPFERPAMASGDDTRLEAGMVLSLDLPYGDLGWGGVHLRDTILVTRDGYGLLNRAARGLVVLD